MLNPEHESPRRSTWVNGSASAPALGSSSQQESFGASGGFATGCSPRHLHLWRSLWFHRYISVCVFALNDQKRLRLVALCSVLFCFLNPNRSIFSVLILSIVEITERKQRQLLKTGFSDVNVDVRRGTQGGCWVLISALEQSSCWCGSNRKLRPDVTTATLFVDIDTP